MYRALLYLAASGMLMAQNAPSPMLSYSTYLRGGFAPLALTADTAGNVYFAGSVMPDPVGPLKVFYVGSQAAQMPILGAIVWVAG